MTDPSASAKYPPDWADEIAVEDFMLRKCMHSMDAGDVICASAAADYACDAYKDGKRNAARKAIEKLIDGCGVEETELAAAGYPDTAKAWRDRADWLRARAKEIK